MGLVQSLFSGCTRCWDAGDTHIVISPSGGWAHAHARPKILFYDKHKPYYEFTNFSPHEVVFEGRRYPTSEHLFQAFKVSFALFNVVVGMGMPRQWGVDSSSTDIRRSRSVYERVVRNRFVPLTRRTDTRQPCGQTGRRSVSPRCVHSQFLTLLGLFLLNPARRTRLTPLLPLPVGGNCSETQVYTTSTFEPDAPRYGQCRTRRGKSIPHPPRSYTQNLKGG